MGVREESIDLGFNLLQKMEMDIGSRIIFKLNLNLELINQIVYNVPPYNLAG